MFETFKALKQEHVVNVKELQKSPSRALRGLTRILRGSMTFGYFLDANTFEDFVEDLEAASSTRYRQRIARARAERGGMTMAQLRKRYGI